MEEIKKKVVRKKKSAAELAKEVQENKEWVIKNRVYKLSGKHKKTPWVHMQSGDSVARGAKRLLYFDKDKGHYRSLRYVKNHPSPFIDDQDAAGGVMMPGHIVFEGGVLAVDAQDVALQKFLDLHPSNEKNGGKGSIKFYEHDPAAIAKAEVDVIISEAEAIAAALNADLATTEAILRPIKGQIIHSKKTEELTRELLILAKSNPYKFMEMINDDTLLINNAAYTAIDFGILKLTDGNRTLLWTDTGEKILSIPFGEDPYAFVGKWFSTDVGLEYLNKVTNKLKKK